MDSCMVHGTKTSRLEVDVERYFLQSCFAATGVCDHIEETQRGDVTGRCDLGTQRGDREGIRRGDATGRQILVVIGKCVCPSPKVA